MRAGRLIRALSQEAGIFAWFAKRHPIVVLLGLIYVGVLAFYGIRAITETPQQAHAREIQERQQAYAREIQERQQAAAASASAESASSERAARIEQTRQLCKIKAACGVYAKSRQSCAIAGNFENCMRIKMGEDNYELRENCTNDGHMLDASSEPTAVDCLFN